MILSNTFHVNMNTFVMIKTMFFKARMFSWEDIVLHLHKSLLLEDHAFNLFQNFVSVEAYEENPASCRCIVRKGRSSSIAFPDNGGYFYLTLQQNKQKFLRC